MSPHFRPEAWTDLADMTLKRPIRVTGPLFFDGSHKPCHDDKRPSPQRTSVWEIHPVYQFEVCTSKTPNLTTCKITDNKVWMPLNDWHQHADNEEEH
jgi:hypothetical protein